jgi:solute carrier family 35 protein F1/2
MSLLFVGVYEGKIPLDTTIRKFFCRLLRYPPYQVYPQGTMICLAGMALLVASDMLTGKNWTAVHKAEGNAFLLAGATLYGFGMLCVGSVTGKMPIFL